MNHHLSVTQQLNNFFQQGNVKSITRIITLDIGGGLFDPDNHMLGKAEEHLRSWGYEVMGRKLDEKIYDGFFRRIYRYSFTIREQRQEEVRHLSSSTQ